MHLKKAEWCEPWMTDEEKRVMKKQMAAMRRLFIKGGVPESPFISMRAIDIGIHHLMVRRLEAKLETDNAPADSAPNCAQLVEQIGKTRERMRKSMRELEEACARLGKPVQIGIAEQLLPLVRKTKHLLKNGVMDEDDPAPESQNNTPRSEDIPVPEPQDTPWSGDILVPEPQANTPDTSDHIIRFGDIPVPEPVPKTKPPFQLYHYHRKKNHNKL